MFGGLHATLNYEETASYCDYVLLGEGDEIISPFVKAVLEKKAVSDIPGVVYWDRQNLMKSSEPAIPEHIDTIPNRNLLYNFKKMAGHDTLWPQVHASRGCPHNCDYCSLVAAFGRKVRVRNPENVVSDIRQAIEFFETGHRRLAKALWITDDNFFADRAWAVQVLKLIIESGINYQFSIQARYEVGFDDEILSLLKQAGFIEIAMGIEFLDDESFQQYHKKSSYQEILDSVRNIQAHGLRVRGLFIVGADEHKKGIGNQLADFVIKNDISGVLIQSMYFVKGTPVYEKNKALLIDRDTWNRCTGKVVHHPKHISPVGLQMEIITASRKIYSFRRLFQAVFRKKGMERVLFIGEWFWQYSVRLDLKRDIRYLKKTSD